MTKQQTARDVMQSQVLTVSPDDPLHVVQRLFYEESIHGAPVVGEDGQVIGIITSTDILRAANEAHEVAGSEPVAFVDDLDLGDGAWGMTPEVFRQRLQHTTVADHMTDSVVVVDPETPVGGVARRLLEHQVHRVLVIEDGKLCGIVSTFDLIGLLDQ